MEVRGRIHKIEDTVQASATFKKRNLVLVIEGQYPQYPLFEFAQDRVTLLDSFSVGDEVEVSFDLNGREWTSPQGEVKYFTTLKGYMIKGIHVQGPTAAAYAPPAHSAPAQPATAEPANADPMMALWKDASRKYTETQRASLGYTSEADWKKAIAANKTPESLAAFMQQCETKLAADDDLPF